MEIYVAIIITAVIFILGLFVGSIATYFVLQKFNKKQLEFEKESYSEVYEKMQLQFENLSNKIYKETTQDFSNTSKERINEILAPFKDKFDELKKQSAYNIEQSAKLDMHIKEVIETGSKISNDTNTLASALKGDNMKQGKWGELILERVLELSGLRRGEEYLVQTGTNSKKPDATILLPENKAIFVDAKTSLASYDAYINADTEESSKLAMNQFKASVKAHITGLAQREYFDTEEYSSPEYVLMFIPIESCYTMLFADNSELWELAWKNKIMPVSPSTLLASLKIINSFNMVNRQNKNAQEIAYLAGKMMDKLSDVVKELNSIQKNLSSIMKKMCGKDNVIRQCERLSDLGAKHTKQLIELDIPVDDDICV